MTQVKYIGTVDTKVRVAGVKIDVAPNDIFEMDEAEAKDLLNGYAYRDLFIEEGAELTEKQNPNNKKAPVQEIIGAGGSKYDFLSFEEIKAEVKKRELKAKGNASKQALIDLLDANDKEVSEQETANTDAVSETIAKIAAALTIDDLNIIATEVANNEEIGENDEVNKAIEDKMAEFLAQTDEEAPKTDANTEEDATQGATDENTANAKKKAV